MKKYLLISLIALLLIGAILGFVYLNKQVKDVFNGVHKNDPEIENLVTISQAEISSFVFVTQESETDHRLNINLTPFLIFNIEEKEIEKFKIYNFKSKGEIGEGLLIHPTELSTDTVSRTFLFTVTESIKQEDIISNGDNIEYSIVSEVTKFNEVANTTIISPYFGIIIKDIGTVNYKEILDRDDVFDGSKYLEYSGITLDKLNTEIQFDVYIEFSDSSKYTKRFKTTIEGEKLGEEISPMFILQTVN